MIWELRGSDYYAKNAKNEYRIKPGPGGWHLTQRTIGDESWETAGIYISAMAASKAMEVE